jgi:hypothetical protein
MTWVIKQYLLSEPFMAHSLSSIIAAVEATQPIKLIFIARSGFRNVGKTTLDCIIRAIYKHEQNAESDPATEQLWC